MPEPVLLVPAPHAPWSKPARALALTLLLAVYLFCSCYHLADIPLIDPDEPRYATAGRNMAEGGSWLLPEFNGKPRINKPPLFYWLVALSDLLFGPATEVSSRLPSLVMGLLMLLLTVWLGARLYGERTGYLAGLILCTSPLFMVMSRWCITDQTFSTLLTAALACLLLDLTGRWPFSKQGLRHPLLAAALCLGLACMTKGTGALVVLLVLALFVLLFARHEFANLIRYASASPWLPALWIAVLLSSWWYAYLAYALGWEEIVRLVDFEVLGRIKGKVHQEPFYYFLYVLLGYFFPWSLGLPAALGCACRRIALGLPLQAATAGEAPAPGAVRAVTDSFLVAWIAGVMLFFSIPGSKLGTYIFPAFPAAALLTARYLLRLSGKAEPLRNGWRWTTASVALVMVAGLIAFGAIPFTMPKDVRTFFEDLPVSRMTLALLFASGFCLPWILGCSTRKPWTAAFPLAASMVLLFALALPLGMPALRKKSHRALAAEIQPRVQTAAHLFMAGSDEESLVYYLHRTLPDVPRTAGDRRTDVVEALASGPPGDVLIFVHRKYFTIWMQDVTPPGSQVLARGNHIVVLLNQAP